jgi:hypothetical protein
MDEVGVLEANKVEWVTRAAADPAEAGREAKEGAQAGRVGGIYRLPAQPHRHKDHHRSPTGIRPN